MAADDSEQALADPGEANDLPGGVGHVYPLGSRINAAGRLEIGGCDVVDLAREVGTPAYVYAEDDLRRRARATVAAFADRVDDFEVLYASKAFPCVAALRILAEEGLSCDVASGGELHLALRGGFDPERIYMHGNNKTPEELEYALASGVGHVIVDSFDEIDRLARVAGGRPQRVLLRVTPGLRPETHYKIATGQEDSKFGIPLAQLPDAVARCEAAGLEVRGLHAHIGSQVFDLDIYDALAEVLAAAGDFPVVNMGGGFAVAYTRDQHPPRAAEFAEKMVESGIQPIVEWVPLAPGQSSTSTPPTATLARSTSSTRGSTALAAERRDRASDLGMDGAPGWWSTSLPAPRLTDWDVQYPAASSAFSASARPMSISSAARQNS